MANLFYKQFVRPLLDYADLVFESALQKSIDELNKIQGRTVCIIDRGTHLNFSTNAIKDLYNLRRPTERRREHHLALMYRPIQASRGL